MPLKLQEGLVPASWFDTDGLAEMGNWNPAASGWLGLKITFNIGRTSTGVVLIMNRLSMPAASLLSYAINGLFPSLNVKAA